MRPAQVLGVGFWSPRFPSWDAWRRGEPADEPRRPACVGVPPTILRGASVATCAAVDALRQAATHGAADLGTAATVFGSTFGEIQTAVALSAMIRSEGLPSPMRFKNSVHNAAAGIASIAHANKGFTTSLSAGGDLVAACLLEALCWLDEAGGEAIVVLAEEEVPAPLPRHGAHPALGLALHLRAGEGPLTLQRLALDPAAPVAVVPTAFAGCCAAAAIPLLEAVTAARTGIVALSTGDAPRWRVELVARP